MSSVQHGMLLEQVQQKLTIYYQAMAGRSVRLMALTDEEKKAPPPDTRWTVRLPSEQESGEWYKLAVTHRAMHYEAGTYEFEFGKKAVWFDSLRPQDCAVVPQYDGDSELDWFFRLFSNRALALDLFNVLEDFRVDCWAQAHYKGLVDIYKDIQLRELSNRPDISVMPPRQALAEAIVRLSLHDLSCEFIGPKILVNPIRWAAFIMQSLGQVGTSVEDTAEATIRLGHLLNGLPNVNIPGTKTFRICLSDLESPNGLVRWPNQWPEPEPVSLEGDSVLEVTFKSVSYREQMGFWLRNYEASAPPELQSIFTFRDKPAKTRISLNQDPMAIKDDEFEQDLSRPPKPLPHDHGFEEDDHKHSSGAIHSHDPSVFLYPEWDYRKELYRPEWCAVREKNLTGADSNQLFNDTVRRYAHLIPKILQVIESIAPENLSRVFRMPFGDEVDIDACVTAVTDLQAGVEASENVYVARQRIARDVSVAFLVDLSASTAENVKALGSKSDLVSKQRTARRIIDVEKESMMLMLAVTTQVGDAVGVYGFSGTGRDNVEFYNIKDFRDHFSKEVIYRIGALKPVHTTRMAPAIRHSVRKLARQDSQTKILLIISDGRPFDIDYGTEYGEEFILDYAVQDTRKALDEAQRSGIRPFFLTVDQEGNDYLREMCADIGYEIISDIDDLPMRIVSLYRVLRSI